jgi:hypothetical protein
MSSSTASRPSAQAPYEADTFAWAMVQAQLLRQGRFSEADIAHIAEEIEDMGKERLHALGSAIRNTLVHLTLLKFSPAVDPRSHWSGEVASFRAEIEQRLEDSPSLRRRLADLMIHEWPRARRIAKLKLGDEMELIRELPKESPFTLEQVMNDDFFPAFNAGGLPL